MFLLKVATFFLLALAVGADKKIELQDIEDDNLRSEMKSENENEVEKSDSPQTTGAGTGLGLNSFDFMKNGLMRYFENRQPTFAPYVHQYAVTEPVERQAHAAEKLQFVPSPARSPPQPPPSPPPQQAMVGYLSNIPMQIYLVPQYYSDKAGQAHHHYVGAHNQQPGAARVAAYQSSPEPVQIQSNYVGVPTYVAPTAEPYVHHYSQPPVLTYVTFPVHPNSPRPQSKAAPVVPYQLPVFQYNPDVTVTPTNTGNPYYPNPEYTDSNSVDEISEQDQKQYSTQTEPPYHQSSEPDFPRHYNSRTPIREQYRHHAIPELSHPNPLIFKSVPPHLAHLPKSLPVYRPFIKPTNLGSGSVPSSFTPRPHDHYLSAYAKRPSSLLDSYIPSSVQVEYLKRGLVKDPLSAYDALASGRLPHPRHFERGFLPNQMYHTGGGGVTYGRHKWNPKVDKIPQKWPQTEK